MKSGSVLVMGVTFVLLPLCVLVDALAKTLKAECAAGEGVSAKDEAAPWVRMISENWGVQDVQAPDPRLKGCVLLLCVVLR